MDPCLANILHNQPVGFEQARQVIKAVESQAGALLDLMAVARLQSVGPPVFSCGIINAKSGHCQEDCAFCAQSIHNQPNALTHSGFNDNFGAALRSNVTANPRKQADALVVYPLLDADTLCRRAERLASQGVDYMGIVTSGTAPTEQDFAKILAAALLIKKQVGIKLCASLGLLDHSKALALNQAGFTSYHHNLETAASFFPTICSTHGFNQRLATVRNAKAAGLRVCCGGIFGLGESWEQRIELAMTLRELDVDSIPINFLNPIAGTIFERCGPLKPFTAMAIIAMFRLLHPARDLVICGGRTYNLGHWENMVFSAGANGIMVGDYLTTAGGNFNKDMDMFNVLGLKGRDR